MNDWDLDRQISRAEIRALSLPREDVCEECDCDDEPGEDCHCGCHGPLFID